MRRLARVRGFGVCRNFFEPRIRFLPRLRSGAPRATFVDRMTRMLHIERSDSYRPAGGGFKLLSAR
jgi:hypothetical protein